MTEAPRIWTKARRRSVGIPSPLETINSWTTGSRIAGSIEDQHLLARGLASRASPRHPVSPLAPPPRLSVLSGIARPHPGFLQMSRDPGAVLISAQRSWWAGWTFVNLSEPSFYVWGNPHLMRQQEIAKYTLRFPCHEILYRNSKK